MPLSQEQEEREHDLRVEQMTVNIEKLRADIRLENRRLNIQLLAAVSTAFAAGVAALGLLLHFLGKW